jgi:enediyne biosynthesis thioesterase
LRSFEYRHTVGFEDTNLVGNVYFVNHLRWQGRCREMFLLQHAPEILAELQRGLALATVRCSCDYFAELQAFDQVVLRMSLAAVAQNRLTLVFEYWRRSSEGAEGEELVARGEQQVACMRRTDDAARLGDPGQSGHPGSPGNNAVPTPIPEALRAALRPFAGAGIDL